METRYYIDTFGVYKGSFTGSINFTPRGWIRVPTAPNDIRDTWDGSKWIPYIE